MSGPIKTLAVLGVVQIVLICFVWFKPFDTERRIGSLIQIDAEKIASIKIVDNETGVTLTSDSENWSDSVTVNDKHVGDSKKASIFISQILELSPQWALAQTSEAVKRFELSDSNFQRKVELYDSAHELLETLFTGTSPGFGKVHARVSGNNYVFAVDLANHQLSTNADDWIDKDQLALSDSIIKMNINQMDGTADLWLDQIKGSGWEVNGKIADEKQVNDYLSLYKNLRILGISDPAEGFQDKIASITLTFGNKEIIFNLQKSVNKEFFVSTSPGNEAYRIAEYWVDKLLINESDLLPSQHDSESPGEKIGE